jgi:hypothetical protein
MIEMLKTKSIIALTIMILGVSFIYALDNKKADTVAKQNVGQNNVVLYK